ncbi:MAG: inositol-phosphate phosphatase, partial [Armatimonadetes bacterium]|nr:inositol-phosphate phosphatase [Armatimonadota bacterium]
MSGPVTEVDIAPIRDLVVDAGHRARARWGNVRAEAKPDRSLVTDVDREVESFLAAGVASLHPDAAFAGEEYGRRGAAARDVWVCDPIDGTTNFVMGLPHWCVSLGLVRDGAPAAGVVYAPVLDRLYWAAAGQGAFPNDVQLRCSAKDAIEYEDLLCISTSSLKTLRTSGIEARLRCLGSIALEVALVAEGRAIGAVGF